MELLQEKLLKLLKNQGADLAGVADLRGLAPLPVGISVAVALPKTLVASLEQGPNAAYYDAYFKRNQRLDAIVTAGAEFLRQQGYQATAMTHDSVVEFDTYRTALPYKTVATRAGLGWIGKSALLVTEEFGPAVRLSALLTDAPLTAAEPITASRCGDCMCCHDACPGGAISGRLWDASTDRDTFFNPLACRQKARELAFDALQKEITLCGRCFVVCPYTRRYLDAD